MPRKPLSKVRELRNAPYELGAHVIETRPEFVSAIGRCITLWPYVEHHSALLLGVLLKTESPATVAVFQALRTGRARQDALGAAAKVLFEPKMFNLFTDIMRLLTRAEGERADIAHGHWGVFRDHPKFVSWIDSKYHGLWNTRALNGAWPQEGHEWLLSHTFVYTLKDIEETYRLIDDIWKILFDFVSLVRGSKAKSPFLHCSGDELFQKLSQSPQILGLKTPRDHSQNVP